MLTTSEDYSPDQRGEFHGTLTPCGSEGVTVTDGDIVLESVTLTENCCDRKFGFGAFIAAQLDMTLKLGGEHDLRAPLLTRAQIELSRRFFDDTDTQTEELPLGHFFIDDASVRRTKTSAAFTAYDASSYFDRPVSADPADVADLTPYEIIEYACECVSACLLLIFGSGYSVTMAQTAAQISGYPNASRQFSWLHTSEEQLTYRDMVCAALGIMGAWGRINRLGQFEIHRFDLGSASYTIDGGNAVKRSISDSAARITGVKYGDITFGSDVQQYDISTNLLMNSVKGQAVGEVVSALGSSSNVTGFGIYTAEVSWFGDLALEAGDCIAYVQDGVTANIIAMETVWKPHGLCTVRAYGVNSESGKTQPSESLAAGTAYIKTDVVTPQIEELSAYVSGDLLGGNTISPKISKDQYNAMPSHDPQKLYIVRDENAGKTELYLGDEHIDTGSGGGGGGTLEYGAVLASEQSQYWIPGHELVPVSYRGEAKVWYGQPPARFVCQGARMLYGVSRADITKDDILSEIALQYQDGSTQRLKVFINYLSTSQISIGADCFDVAADGTETFVARAVSGNLNFSSGFTYDELVVGFIHRATSFGSYGGVTGPQGRIFFAVMADDVLLTDFSTTSNHWLVSISGCYMNSTTAAYYVRKFANEAERNFALAVTTTTEPTVPSEEST